jgi:hypothetical protein
MITDSVQYLRASSCAKKNYVSKPKKMKLMENLETLPSP